MSKVSIIVPVYNGAKFLNIALDSLLNQTLKDIEIIIVNDGSTDNTLQIAKDYQQHDSRIKIVNLEKNMGPYEARIHGFEKASGEYFATCDSDDWYSLDAMEKMYDAAMKNDADIVQGRMILVYENFKEEGWFSKLPENDLIGEDILSFVMEFGRNWSMSGKLIKSSMFLEVIKNNEYPRGEHLVSTEDLLQFLPIAYYSNKLFIIKDDVYFYNRMDEDSSQFFGNYSKDLKRIIDTIEVAKYVEIFLTKKNIIDKYLDWHLNRLSRDMFWQLDSINYSKELCTKGLNLYLGYHKRSLLYILDNFFINGFFEKIDLFSIELNEIFKNKKNIEKIKTIGIYYNRLYNGGVEWVISLLSYIFGAKGYNVIIFLEEITDDDYDIHPNSVKVLIPKDNTKRYTAWKEAIDKYDIDTVIYNDWLNESIRYDSIFIKHVGIPLVTSTHGIFSTTYWQSSHINYILVQSSFMRLADAVITLSGADSIFYNTMGAKRAYYIQNPITFDSKELEISKLNNKNILWLGRFDMIQKKPLAAIEAFAKVVKTIPDAKFIIVGNAETKEEDNIVYSKIKELKIEKNCELVGFTKNVLPYILNSSVHIMTSRFEGFPMVLGEVKSHGVPTVMFDLPYLEMLRDSKGIITVEQGNTDALAIELIKVLTDDDYRLKLGKEAKESLEPFLEYDTASAWEKVFDDIVNGKKCDNSITIEDTRPVIGELIECLKNSKLNQQGSNIDESLIPYFFSIITSKNRCIVRLLGIKITLKTKNYYHKPIVITTSQILRQIFSIKKEEDKYLVLRLIGIKLSIKLKVENIIL